MNFAAKNSMPNSENCTMLDFSVCQSFKKNVGFIPKLVVDYMNIISIPNQFDEYQKILVKY